MIIEKLILMSMLNNLIRRLVLRSVLFHPLNILCGDGTLNSIDDVVESQDSNDWEAVLSADLADGAWCWSAIITGLGRSLLETVQRHNNAGDNTSLGLNLVDGLSARSACSDKIGRASCRERVF